MSRRAEINLTDSMMVLSPIISEPLPVVEFVLEEGIMSDNNTLLVPMLHLAV